MRLSPILTGLAIALTLTASNLLDDRNAAAHRDALCSEIPLDALESTILNLAIRRHATYRRFSTDSAELVTHGILHSHACRLRYTPQGRTLAASAFDID